MKLENAVFDMDGTLLNSMHIWNDLCIDYLIDHGYEVKPGFRERFFPLTIREGAELFKSDYDIPGTVDEIVADINATAKRLYIEKATIKPGVVELLEELSVRGVGMAVATTTDKALARFALEMFGIGKYFPVLHTCSEAGRGKKFPDVYDQAAAMIGAKRENTAVFEDSYFAVKTAHAAGYFTVGVYDVCSEAKAELIKESADLYCTTLVNFPVDELFAGR